MNTSATVSDAPASRSLTDFRGAPDPMVRVSRLGAIGIETPDVERLVAYYVEALGFVETVRSDGWVYLTTNGDHHSVAIGPGDAGARSYLGFQIHGSLDEAAARLRDHGVAAETQSDVVPGIAASVVIEEPGGTPLHLYEAQAPSGKASRPGVSPSKLGHVASHVADLPKVQVFYEDVLGFRWSDRVGDFFTFLRCGPDHHTINLLAKPTADGGTRGMHHVAYEMRNLGHLRDGLDYISKFGCIVEWGLGRHGAGHNLFSYHRDPDGNLVELYAELDQIYDESTGHFEPRPWHEEFPQGPRVWEPGRPTSNIWGPMPPW